MVAGTSSRNLAQSSVGRLAEFPISLLPLKIAEYNLAPNQGVFQNVQLSKGMRLGPYEILAALGVGGMGEVYRARDTRLNRTVAIKILPAGDQDYTEPRQRFKREAETIASLKHPHICALYDLGKHEGADFLVMEYLEGETLAQRLTRGPLPLEQALRYGVETADALDRAHRQGVVHRDLKPANVMLTRDGVKLLDFGLAKLRPSTQVTGLSEAATESPNLTARGAIIGTLQYMAPEQLEGQEADARTDIFAFGTMLYEMLTGGKAFNGKSQASLIAAILEHEPAPISTLRPMAPPILDHLVNRCLAKDPEERWQGAADLMRELKWVAEPGSRTELPGPAVAGRRRRVLGIGLTGLFVCATAGMAIWNLRAEKPKPVIRSIIPISPAEALPADDLRPSVAISPDGTRLVYVGRIGTSTEIYVRRLNRLEAEPIAGTEGGSGPFFSPDGEWVGFFAGGKLKKVSLSGGAPITVASAEDVHGATWGPDDTIFYTPALASGLWRVSASGGVPQQLSTPSPDQLERTHRLPDWLPGGKAVIFTMGSAEITSYNDARIEALTLATGERRVVIDGGFNARYVSTGHIVYARAGSLFAVAFDPSRLEVKGSPFLVLEGLATDPTRGIGDFSVSREGTLVYAPGSPRNVNRKLVWVDREGRTEPVIDELRGFRTPRLSPDGERIAVTIDGGTDQLWVLDMARGTLTRQTFAWGNRFATWTPDGKRLTFGSNRHGSSINVYWQAADGSGTAERLTTSSYEQRPAAWSADGRGLAFSENHPTTGTDIWVLPMEGERKAAPLLQSSFNEMQPTFSPDGRWLAYVSDESDRPDVYVQPFPGSGSKRQISTDGGTEPVWARNGRELFYWNGERLMAVGITTVPTFIVTKPALLFRGTYSRDRLSTNYDVAPDGRFLMIENHEKPLTQLNLVLNWFEELKHPLPTARSTLAR